MIKYILIGQEKSISSEYIDFAFRPYGHDSSRKDHGDFVLKLPSNQTSRCCTLLM